MWERKAENHRVACKVRIPDGRTVSGVLVLLDLRTGKTRVPSGCEVTLEIAGEAVCSGRADFEMHRDALEACHTKARELGFEFQSAGVHDGFQMTGLSAPSQGYLFGETVHLLDPVPGSAGAGSASQESGMYLWLRSEGWVRRGPFKHLALGDEPLRVVDEKGRTLVVREAAERWVEPSHGRRVFEVAVITVGPEHPSPRRGAVAGLP